MRGFSNANFRSARPVEVTLRQLAKTFEANATVDLVAMQKNGLVSSDAKFVKIIGSQDLAMPLIVQAHAFSKGAREAILRAGGRVMVGNVAAESIRCAGVDDVPQAGAEMAVSSEESDA
jgi:large subunit ribosomal protein L15